MHAAGKAGQLSTQNQSIRDYSLESNILSMPISRTTASISLKSSSLTQYCTSCEIQFSKMEEFQKSGLR